MNRHTKSILKARKYCMDLVLRARVKLYDDNLGDVYEEMRRGLQKAIKFDLNREVSDLAFLLQLYFINREGKASQIEKYSRVYKEYQHRIEVEETVNLEVQYIRRKLNASLNPSQKLKQELSTVCDRLQPYLELKSPSISKHIYLILYKKYELERNTSKMIAICKEAIELIQPTGGARHYWNGLIQAYTLAGEFEKAEAAVKEGLADLKKSNVFDAITINHVVLHFYKGDFNKAYEVFSEVRGYDKKMEETFNILKSYFAFLYQCGELSTPVNSRVNKFLNDVVIYQRDKAGQNINIIILQILYNLGRKNGVLIDRYDAFRVYNSKYGSGRAYLFIKMLLKIVQYKFNLTAIRFRTENDLEELKNLSRNLDVEYVPYEVLWELACGMLEKKRVH